MEHIVVAVHIEGDKVRVECECGRRSVRNKTEADGRVQHENHAVEKAD